MSVYELFERPSYTAERIAAIKLGVNCVEGVAAATNRRITVLKALKGGNATLNSDRGFLALTVTTSTGNTVNK